MTDEDGDNEKPKLTFTYTREGLEILRVYKESMYEFVTSEDSSMKEIVTDFWDTVTGKKPLPKCNDGCDGQRCIDCKHNPMCRRKRKYDRFRKMVP